MALAQADELKREAAVRAAEWIRDGMVVGLGTGTTVRFLLDEIAARRAGGEWASIVGVPTSEATAARARQLGIPLATLSQHPHLDLTIDGADEVDPSLDLIKGLGGALLREKIVATASETFVVIVDASKRVERLGTRAPVPVEVDPFGAPTQPSFFRELGAQPELRRDGDGSPYVTDGGNYIFDCRFPDGIADAGEMERMLKERPGVMENGIFAGVARHVVVAGEGGVQILSRGGGGK